jgi:hypothetical protein
MTHFLCNRFIWKGSVRSLEAYKGGTRPPHPVSASLPHFTVFGLTFFLIKVLLFVDYNNYSISFINPVILIYKFDNIQSYKNAIIRFFYLF